MNSQAKAKYSLCTLLHSIFQPSECLQLNKFRRLQTKNYSVTWFFYDIMYSMCYVAKSVAGKPTLKETPSIMVPSPVPLDSTPTTHHTYTSPCNEWRILTWNIITQGPLGSVQPPGSRPASNGRVPLHTELTVYTLTAGRGPCMMSGIGGG